MDRQIGKRHMHADTSPSFDTECLSSPAKQLKITSEDLTATVLSPKKSSTSKEYLVSPLKQSDISIEEVLIKKTVPSLQQEEASTSKENLVSPAKTPSLSVTTIPTEIKTIAFQVEGSFISEDTDSKLNPESKNEKKGGGSLAIETSNFENAIKYENKTGPSLQKKKASTSKKNSVSPAKQPTLSVATIPTDIKIIDLKLEVNFISEDADSKLNPVSKTEKNGGRLLATKTLNFENAIKYKDKTDPSLQQEEASTSKDNLVLRAKQVTLSVTTVPTETKPTALQIEENFISEDTDSKLNVVSKPEKNGGGPVAKETLNFENAAKYENKTASSLQYVQDSTSEENSVSPAKQPTFSVSRIPTEIKPIALHLEVNFISEDAGSELNPVSKAEKNGDKSLATDTLNLENAINYEDETAPSLQEEKASTTKENPVSPANQPTLSTQIPSEIKPIALQLEDNFISEDSNSNLNPVSKIEKNDDESFAKGTSSFENFVKYEGKRTKDALESSKSNEQVLECTSFKDASTTTAESTSKIQDDHAKGGLLMILEHIPEKLSAQELEEEYITKYASVYTTELVFAVHVVYLVRLLNGLVTRPISYASSGKAPKSPCDDVINDALIILWEKIKIKHGALIESHIKHAGLDYSRFQRMMLQQADVTEQKTYNTARILKYCVTIAQWAVCSEMKGIPQAVEFAPLVICRTFQNLKDAGKMPLTFWELMAQKAKSINQGDRPEYTGCRSSDFFFN